MQQLIEQIAGDNGISLEDAGTLFTAFTSVLIGKIPQLKQVIEDVFTNVDADLLQEHIDKAISLLQQQEANKYKSWLPLPQQHGGNKYTGGNGELF